MCIGHDSRFLVFKRDRLPSGSTAAGAPVNTDLCGGNEQKCCGYVVDVQSGSSLDVEDSV